MSRKQEKEDFPDSREPELLKRLQQDVTAGCTESALITSEICCLKQSDFSKMDYRVQRNPWYGPKAVSAYTDGHCLGSM